VGLVNSLGFAGSYKGSYCNISVRPLAEDKDGKKQSGGWYSYSHSFKNLEKPEEVGRKASERALRQLGARKIPTTKVPVVWEAEVAGDFLRELAGAVNGNALFRHNSFLLDMEGQQLGSDLLTIVDDPLRPGLLGTRPFDGEGIASRRNAIFTKGVFEQFLFNTYAARKSGRRSTGSASAGIGSFPYIGITNFYLEAGKDTPEAIIGGVQNGLLLTELMGFGVNPVTGDLSQGAAGLWIENGQVTYPVSEINISGNIKDMLKNLVQVGNDLEFRSSIAAPTLRINDIMVSGL
jgi:PmbA protein